MDKIVEGESDLSVIRQLHNIRVELTCLRWTLVLITICYFFWKALVHV